MSLHFCVYLRQTVNGPDFHLVDGSCVLFDVFEAAVAEEVGYYFDVGAVLEDVGGETVAGAVPCDVLADSGF